MRIRADPDPKHGNLYYTCMCGSGSVFRIRILIQKGPEYGSNTDPDPKHCFKDYSDTGMFLIVYKAKMKLF